MEDLVLALDIGTSSLKAALVAVDGRVIAHTALGLSWTPGLEQHFPASRWEEAFVELYQRLSAHLPHGPVAISVSGHGPSLVPVDALGEPSSSVMFWLDTRSERLPGYPSFFLPKIRWFESSNPVSRALTVQYISCPEYLLFRLGARSATISPQVDFDKFFWSVDQIEAYGVHKDALPGFARPGDLLGYSGGTLASRAGLPQGVPLFSGGSDFLMALLGTGALEEGICCDRAGSSEGINACTDKEIRSTGLRTLPHLRPGFWNVAGIIPASGLLFEWFRTVTGQKDRDYRSMLEDICNLGMEENIPTFIPDPESKGTFSQGAFLGFETSHGPAHLSRAVVESIGFMVRDSLTQIRDTGLEVKELRMCGGQAKNALWCQLKADITGQAIMIPELADAELMGNAIVAWFGLGRYADLGSGAKAMVRIARTWEPRDEARLHFDRAWERWSSLRTSVAGKSFK